MTHSDDLLRRKNLRKASALKQKEVFYLRIRIEAMEDELQNLKEQLTLSEAQVKTMKQTLNTKRK